MSTVWSPCWSFIPIQALQGGWCLLTLFKSQSHISPLYSPTCLRWCAREGMFYLGGCTWGFSLQRSSQLPPIKSLLQRCCCCSRKTLFLVVLYRDIGVSAEKWSRVNLAANDSKSLATETLRQEQELFCDCWEDLRGRGGLIEVWELFTTVSIFQEPK